MRDEDDNVVWVEFFQGMWLRDSGREGGNEQVEDGD